MQKFRTVSRILLSLFIICLVSSLTAAEAGSKLNVLFIVVDDMRNDLGCYGSEQVKTPHIDRFAQRGIAFQRAYCQYPICSPSRSSVLTGLRPDSTGVNNNYEQNWKHFREKVPDVVTLPQLFRKNGYFSARVGKIYHYGVPREIGLVSLLDDAPSWDLALYPRGSEKDEEDLVGNCTPNRSIGWGLTWAQSDSRGEDHTDGKVATETIKLLEEHRDKPFFIAAGFYRPHVPCVAPREYFAMYPRDEITLPEEPVDHFDGIPNVAFDPLLGVPENSEECLIDFKRAYYASVSFVDEQIGRVLNSLESLGLYENTVVVLWGDHGWMLGEHGQWEKRTLFEECVRAPLIFYSPTSDGMGAPSNRIVEFLDMYPTIAELCGIEIPSEVEGKSLVPLLDDPDAVWDFPAHSQIGRRGMVGRSVRTDRWRYTEWNGGKDGIELYDHDADPKEYRNLALELGHGSTIDRLKALLPEGQ